MENEYKLEDSKYVYYLGGEVKGEPLDAVAIVFDKETGTLHKHGPVEGVTRWAEDAQRKFREGGFPDMADDLIVLSGRFTLEDLNRCLSNSGFPALFYQRVIRGEAKSLD